REIANTDYAPGNCRWLDKTGQANNRSTTLWLTIDGVEKPLSQWASETSQRAYTIRHRVRAGASHKQAVFGDNSQLRGRSRTSARKPNGFPWLRRDSSREWEDKYQLAMEKGERRRTR